MSREYINKKGSIIISVILICMLIMVIVMGFNSIIAEQGISIQSNISSIRAYYIAESAAEYLTYELNLICEEAIFKYFQQLYDYNLYYLTLSQEELYSPPIFKDILSQEINYNLASLSYLRENPFKEYQSNHFYQIYVVYIESCNIIKAEIIGSYRQSRKLLKVELELPTEFMLLNDSSETAISSLRNKKRYQTTSLDISN